MSLEKQFRWMTDKAKVGKVPIGKSLLLILFMGFPGKFIPFLVRWIMAKTLSPTAPDYMKKVDIWTQVLGSLAGFGAAYGVKKGLRGVLGETGAEAMALGTLTGALDGGFNRVGRYEEDLSDIIGHGARDKLLDLIGKVKGTALAGPGDVARAAGTKATRLAGFPEAGSSAWREQEKFLAGPGGEKPTETGAGQEVAAPKQELGAPQAPADPVQLIEETLAAKSQL